MRRRDQNIVTETVSCVRRLGILVKNFHCLHFLIKVKTSKHNHLVATAVTVVYRIHGSISVLVESSERCRGGDEHLGAKKRPFGFLEL